jgi:hypothetical protein
LGDKGGAGNLIICEVVLLHVSEDVLNENKQIDPLKIDLVARLGGNWYSRTTSNSLFEVNKPLANLGIGVDQLPENIRYSQILTGNNLGQLANVERLPEEEIINSYKNSECYKAIIAKHGENRSELKKQVHLRAKQLLDDGNIEEAWKILLATS